MISKDDRKYIFVVTRATRSNSLRIRRIQISRRLIQFCISALILTFGISSYKNFNSIYQSNSLVISEHQAASLNSDSNAFLAASFAENPVLGEGGPDITEDFVASNESTNFKNQLDTQENSTSIIEDLPSIYPLTGRINDDFGWRRNPFSGNSSEFHSGLDISGEKGDIIVAPANGIVIKAGWSGGYGNMIEISHGSGLSTRYGHLSQIDVEIGESIVRGQEIGNVGSTGRSTGPHLHYEVRMDDKPINPHVYLPESSVKP